MTDQEKNKQNLLERKYMARLMAVQALYSQDVLGEDRETWEFDSLNENLIQFFHEQARGEETNKKIDKKFFKILTEGASRKMVDLDDMIVVHFDEDWLVERVGPLMMSILRAAAFELTENITTARIVMSEYAGLAADFFDETEVSFVNAVLDKVARASKAEGMSDLQERMPKANKYAKQRPVVVNSPSTKNPIVVDAPKLMLKRSAEPVEEDAPASIETDDDDAPMTEAEIMAALAEDSPVVDVAPVSEPDEVEEVIVAEAPSDVADDDAPMTEAEIIAALADDEPEQGEEK
jgi:N utilization substance protein B